MIFFSYKFLIFTFIFFTVFWISPGIFLRKLVLLLSCIIFHTYYAGPAGVLPILVLGLGTYLIGLAQNKRLCILWIGICVLFLIFYKYTYFFFEGIVGYISPNLSQMGVGYAKNFLPEIPPLAISFFTFEFVHYLVEVSRGNSPIKSPLNFAIFSVFWPSLVAGPVKRYHQFIDSMTHGMKRVGFQNIFEGAFRVSVGIAKKFAGDNLTGWISYLDVGFSDLSFGMRWFTLLLIGLRILLDFSGYTDMAIGFAQMMGIKLPENFNWPYLATSVDDFWRRWHISLSSWIRDYVYIPLGGGKLGVARKVGNAFIAMVICGLWHGASWNFIAWGIYHGLGLAISGSGNRILIFVDNKYQIVYKAQNHFPYFCNKFFERFITLLSWALTFLFVLIGWLLFFYPVEKAWNMFKALFQF